LIVTQGVNAGAEGRVLKWERFLPLLVVAAGVLAYANSFRGGFVFDDNLRIRLDLEIRNFSSAMLCSTRPLVGLSMCLNYLVGQLNPADYHLVNMAIHVAAGLTLFGVVRRTLIRSARFAPHAAMLSAAAAAIWVAHPLQTESVTYIVQRAESMMGLFYLLALYGFIRGLDSRRPDRWQTASVVCCALGMATKPVMVTAPVMVLLYDRVFVSGSMGEALRRRGPYYAALACTWLVLAALLLAPNESSTSAGFRAGMVSPALYLLTQQGVVLHYLKLAIRPSGLCLDYGWPPAEGLRDVLLPCVVIGALFVGSCWATWRRRPVGFLGMWFFLILAPTSSVVPVADFAVEHRMYLSLAAVVVLAVLGWHWIVHSVSGRGTRRAVLRTAAEVLVFASVAVALCVLTAVRNRDYFSIETMARDTIAKRPTNFRAHVTLVGELIGQARFREAEEEGKRLLQRLEAALKAGGRQYTVSATSPSYFIPVAQDQLGRALLCQGKTEEAIPYLSASVQSVPETRARHNLALALYLRGNADAALAEVRTTLRYHPDYGEAHGLLGFLLAERGDFEGAIRHYRTCVRRAPEFLFARVELAWLLASCPEDGLRNGVEAVRVATAVCEATGYQSVQAWDVLGAAYAETGNYEDAARAAERALELTRPGSREGDGADVGGRLTPGRQTVTERSRTISERLRLYRDGRPFRMQRPDG